MNRYRNTKSEKKGEKYRCHLCETFILRFLCVIMSFSILFSVEEVKQNE